MLSLSKSPCSLYTPCRPQHDRRKSRQPVRPHWLQKQNEKPTIKRNQANTIMLTINTFSMGFSRCDATPLFTIISNWSSAMLESLGELLGILVFCLLGSARQSFYLTVRLIALWKGNCKAPNSVTHSSVFLFVVAVDLEMYFFYRHLLATFARSPKLFLLKIIFLFYFLLSGLYLFNGNSSLGICELLVSGQSMFVYTWAARERESLGC